MCEQDVDRFCGLAARARGVLGFLYFPYFVEELLSVSERRILSLGLLRNDRITGRAGRVSLTARLPQESGSRSAGRAGASQERESERDSKRHMQASLWTGSESETDRRRAILDFRGPAAKQRASSWGASTEDSFDKRISMVEPSHGQRDIRPRLKSPLRTEL